jgi:hypothetical protein
MLDYVYELIFTRVSCHECSLVFSLDIWKLGPLFVVDIQDEQGLTDIVVDDSQSALIYELFEVYREFSRLFVGAELIGPAIV